MRRTWEQTRRVEQFSDGVIAIAITILVLQINIPQRLLSNLGRELLGLWPSYLAFVISFLTIGRIWLVHHTIFSAIRAVDIPFLRANTFLLMLVSFLPFPTAVLSQSLTTAETETWAAVVFYGASMLVCRLLLLLLWRIAVTHDLLRDDANQDGVRLLTTKLNQGSRLYLLAMVVSYLRPAAGPWLYLAIALIVMFEPRGVGPDVFSGSTPPVGRP